MQKRFLKHFPTAGLVVCGSALVAWGEWVRSAWLRLLSFLEASLPYRLSSSVDLGLQLISPVSSSNCFSSHV